MTSPRVVEKGYVGRCPRPRIRDPKLLHNARLDFEADRFGTVLAIVRRLP